MLTSLQTVIRTCSIKCWESGPGLLCVCGGGGTMQPYGSGICVSIATHIKLRGGVQVVDFKPRWRNRWRRAGKSSSWKEGQQLQKWWEHDTRSIPTVSCIFLRVLCAYLPSNTVLLSPHRRSSSHRFKSTVRGFHSTACFILNRFLKCSISHSVFPKSPAPVSC